MSKLELEKRIYRSAGKELSHAEFRVLVIVMTYTDAKGENAHPALTRLIDETGCSRSAVWKALQVLQEKGYLVKTEQGGNQVAKGRANVYKVQDPAAAKGSLTGRKGSLSEHEGFSHRTPSDPTPDPGSDPVFHVDLRSSDQPEGFHDHRSAATPADLPEQGPREVLDAIQAVASTKGGNYSEPYEHFLHTLRVHYSPELADYAELRHWTMSPKQRDPYGEQSKLNMLLNTARLENVDIYGTPKAA